MEITPTNVTLALAIIAFIVWLVRLESKANTTTRDLNDISKDFYTHGADKSVHHDGDELNRRFSVIDTGMQAIQRGIDKLNERFDRFLEK